MRNLKFPFLQALFSLAFIECFCVILLFAIEDYSGIDEKLTISKISIFNFGFDYWTWMAMLVCSGIAAISMMFLKNKWAQRDRILSLTVTGFFVLGLVLSFGYRLSKYFNFENTSIDGWLYGLDIFSALLYFTLVYVSDKWQNTNDNKFRYITIGIFSACSICAFGVSNHYMPMSVMKNLNKDYNTVRKVNELESKLVNKEDIGILPDGIEIREENGQKVISWNMISDHENLDKKIKITKRLKFKFGGDLLIPGINKKHKQGKNERVVGSESFKKIDELKKM